jgi:hypothetical protein
MVPGPSVLVALLSLVDRIPQPHAAVTRGRPRVYSDRLFLKALVVMIVRHLASVHALLAVLAEPEMAALRSCCTEDGRFPARRTWERRLAALPATLPAQIGCLGRYLLGLLNPWAEQGPAAAIDSTVLAAKGGVWHRKDREAGVVPHSSIDTEAGWTKSGWHGWVYGWKLHVVATIGSIWIPLAAELTPANTADNVEAPALFAQLPLAVRFILGDQSYNDPLLYAWCETSGRVLVATQRGAYPHTDDGVEVRRVFHQLRSHSIENFNSQFKGIFACGQHVQTKGLLATTRFALGSILVYQLALLHRFEAGQDLRIGLKPLLQAA